MWLRLAAVFIALSTNQASAAPAPASPEKAFVSEVREALDLALKDYPSARFKQVRIAFTPGGHRLVCGLVNSKATTGGYAGWEYFWADVPEGGAVTLSFSYHDECSAYDVTWLPKDFAPVVTK